VWLSHAESYDAILISKRKQAQLLLSRDLLMIAYELQDHDLAITYFGQTKTE
jgi:hypothetical protein